MLVGQLCTTTATTTLLSEVWCVIAYLDQGRDDPLEEVDGLQVAVVVDEHLHQGEGVAAQPRDSFQHQHLGQCNIDLAIERATKPLNEAREHQQRNTNSNYNYNQQLKQNNENKNSNNKQ